ncbi:hypothetical protein D3C85_1749990 [compost metagenome]
MYASQLMPCGSSITLNKPTGTGLLIEIANMCTNGRTIDSVSNTNATKLAALNSRLANPVFFTCRFLLP